MRVLLIVDDSEDSTRAVEAVQRKPWPPGTKFLVLAVVPRHHLPPPPPPMLLALHGDWGGRRDEARHARVQVELAVEALESSGLKAEGKVRLGHSQSGILEAAREWSADLIVIGSPKPSPLRRFLAGRYLASSVVASAPCSVDVIREKDETVFASLHASDGREAVRRAS